MPECFKDDNASQWKSGKFDPRSSETPEPIVTKMCMGDYVMDPYTYAKFHHDTITPLRPQICENAPQVIRLVFTALHAMHTRSSDENSVRLSVRPSVRLFVTRVHCDKTVESFFQIYILYERTFIPVS